jgi:AcrR family transcriptional regulator
MSVSRQSIPDAAPADRGPRARTRRLMLETATRLMQEGITPSVSEVAEAAQVSRATAYRYFPSQAALVHAVVDAALGPILSWKNGSMDAAERVEDLFRTSLPRIEEFEATFKAALKLSLDQWARGRAGALGTEPKFTRGHRIDLLNTALAPLRARYSKRQTDRLAQALSLLFGIEALVVLKDIWGLNSAKAQAVVIWAAAVLVNHTAAAQARPADPSSG